MGAAVSDSAPKSDGDAYPRLFSSTPMVLVTRLLWANGALLAHCSRLASVMDRVWWSLLALKATLEARLRTVLILIKWRAWVPCLVVVPPPLRLSSLPPSVVV